MEVKEAIAARRSIRKYLSKPIPDEIMAELLEAMRLAPSANNRQPWSVIVVTDEDMKRKLVPVSGGQRFVGECSAYLVGVTDRSAPYSMMDLTMALDHLTLRAVELGLGTCWIGDFKPEEVKKMLGIPQDKDVPICMTVGYPVQTPTARRRKTLSELFKNNAWSTPWP